jgi:hypothetical protein
MKIQKLSLLQEIALVVEFESMKIILNFHYDFHYSENDAAIKYTHRTGGQPSQKECYLILMVFKAR